MSFYIDPLENIRFSWSKDNIEKQPKVGDIEKRSFLIMPFVFLFTFAGLLLCLVFVYQFWKRRKKDEEKHLLKMRELDTSSNDIEMMSDNRNQMA